MTITELPGAIASELSRGVAGLSGAAVMLVSTVERAWRGRYAPRLASLDHRLLRDIGYTRHGVSEAALAVRNEARP